MFQAVVSPNSSSVFEPSSSNDKFCITEEQEGDIEEDEVKTQGERSGGFTSVALTGQITSPLRDKKMGFRSSSSSFNMEAENLFPTFDSQPTNFHVQSDWESASEVEDRYSQLEHINKESLYEAYRKVYNRYNRVKNKYQELATHYRLLEREKDKAKSNVSLDLVVVDNRFVLWFRPLKNEVSHISDKLNVKSLARSNIFNHTNIIFFSVVFLIFGELLQNLLRIMWNYTTSPENQIASSLIGCWRSSHKAYLKVEEIHALEQMLTSGQLLTSTQSVLAETQDKTLMRIGELKEQCQLEQQAKAHLEEALRNELEERDHIIKTLKTKVQYLKAVNEGTVSENLDVKKTQKAEGDNLIDFTENICVSKVPLPSDASNNEESIPSLENQLERCKKFLLEKTSKLEQLEKEVEELKKPKPYEERSSRFDSDDICLDHQKSKEELEMYLCLRNFISELGEEVKAIQENRISHLPLACVNKQVNLHSSVEEDIDDKHVFESTAHMENSTKLSEIEHNLSGYGDATNIPFNSKCLHNIANCDELKELKSQCELLKQKLEEEVVLTKNLKTELNSVNELVCTVRTNLKTSRENYENDNFNFKTSIQTDSDILSDLNFCIDSLYSTRKEFIELENLKVKLEDEVRNMKDKLSLLKSDQAIQTDYDSDKIQHEEEMSISELMDVNDELKQKLEILENEYSNLQDKEVSLSTTVNDLTLENQKLQSKIESLNIALEGMKKDYIVQQMSSEQASLDFDKNASLLKNQISSLEEELKNTNINNSLQLDSKEKNITILKENNCEILQRNSVLQLENDKLKSELEKSNADRKILSEDQEKLLNEMIILRAQHDDLTIENKSVSKQNVEFENTEEMTQHEEISISELMVANEELKQRLESLTKEYDGLLDKKDSLSTTVNDLTLENQKLQSKIESLNISLEGLKKDYIVQQTRLEQASLDFNRNTNLLKDQISSLEEELKNTIINNSVQLDSKEKNITILKENNSELLERNNVLQVENNKLKSELEESNRDREILIEEKDKLLNEMISLKMQNDELTSENKSICEKVVELENYNKKACNDLLVAADEKEKSLHELSLLKQNYDTVNSEKIILTGKVSNLENDAEKMKNDLALILEEKEKLLCDTSLSRKECDNIITEKNMLDEKINKLENQCEKTSIELELSLKKVTQLTEEMSSLRKNHKELIEENKNLHNTIDRVKKELESNKSKYLSTSEEKNKMSDEMQLLKKEQESLIIIKDTLQSKILSLEDELNGTKKEILSSTENKNKLNNTIQELKKECEIKTVKMSEIQKNFDNLLPRYEKLQKEITELTEAKLKLHDELDILKKEYSDTFQTLNVTKKQLEDQLTYSADLDKKLSACSETLKRKCNDVEEKCLENVSLRTDLEDLLIKLNNKSSVVECLAKDKELLINNLLLRVDSMKNIKNLQQNIAVFIQQFRAEMIKELNDVKYKVQNELMHHININLENEACTKKIAEAENKSKQDIDSYKRKINYLLIELQNLIDMSNSQLSDKDNSLDSVDRVRHCVNSNNNVMEQCNGSEENSSPESLDTKLCELRRNILFHQNRCDSLEIEINKAVNIIKSTRRVLKAILEDKILSPIVKLDGDGMEVDETITKKIQEDVLGMELFLKSHESKKSYNNNNASHNADFPNGVFITVEDTLQNINSLTVDKECKKMEVGQLRQEIRIKDDMINKLQQVILGRAEEGEIALIDKSTLTFTQPTVTDNEKINERQLVLEHENKSLLEKLQNIQEKYELNIKSLITKYEQKIEEKEKQIKTSEFEILG
ncbi:Golgi to plasma membrane protein transport [Homalodisca vitripennis]|nr:Golgi to plasma membrane protein transport [Homalodisca vitripennis]